MKPEEIVNISVTFGGIDKNPGSESLKDCEHPGIRRNTALGCNALEGCSTEDEFRVVCAEYIHPLTKIPPEVVIREPDTFILSQLLKLKYLEPFDLCNNLKDFEKNNTVFFVLMDDKSKSEFLKVRDTIIDDFSCNDIDYAFDRLYTFILSFLEDCLKRAKEKAR